MFRLWFLTFFGEYRGAAESPHGDLGAHGHGAWRTAHGHGHGGIHESPRVMVIPLVVLAVLSVVGGWIGVPGSLGGSNRFDKFLGPVFHSTAPAVSAEDGAGETAPPEKETEGPEPQTGHATELIFTGISVLAGLLGLCLAWLLYYRDPQLPQQIAGEPGWPLSGGGPQVLRRRIVRDLVRKAADRRLCPDSVARNRSGRD